MNKGAGGKLNAGLQVFKCRRPANVVQSYGAEFAQSLENMAAAAAPSTGPSPDDGEWRALLTADGWRAIKLDSATAAKPAHFDALRNVVLQNGTDSVMAEQRTLAVRALAWKYTVRDGATRP